MVAHPKGELLIGDGKVRTSGSQLQDAVSGSGGQMGHREFVEQCLEFCNIIAGEELLGEVSGTEIIGEVQLHATAKVALEIVGAHDGIDRQEGEEEHAALLRDPDGLPDGGLDIGRIVQMIHGAEHQGRVEGVVRKSAQIQGISLMAHKIRQVSALFPEDGQVVLHQLQGGDPVSLFCQGDGIPPRASADFQQAATGGGMAVDVFHGGQVFQLSLTGDIYPGILVIVVIKAGDDVNALAHAPSSNPLSESPARPHR